MILSRGVWACSGHATLSDPSVCHPDRSDLAPLLLNASVPLVVAPSLLTGGASRRYPTKRTAASFFTTSGASGAYLSMEASATARCLVISVRYGSGGPLVGSVVTLTAAESSPIVIVRGITLYRVYS